MEKALSTIFWKDPRKTTTSHSQMRKSDESEEVQRGHWHGGEVGDEHSVQYEEVKEMILRCVEMKAYNDGHAMDVDNFEIYNQSDDEGALNMMQKSKGKGVEFYGCFNSCGAWPSCGRLPRQDLHAMFPLRAERPQAQRVSSEGR